MERAKVRCVWVEAVIINSFRVLVDTWTTETVIPKNTAKELQLPVTGKSVVLTAKGPVKLDH
jgi:predicted aspartyl protease